ncbi:MAG: TIGR04283 family arsenosugar biosynthesis glycosyltransferase [Thalassovita sp.]
MRAALTVIVPTLNAQSELPSCLSALMEGLQVGLIRELIVSDGGSKDETLRIADEVGARIALGAPSRGGQLARGSELAQGEWLLFLHADTVLSPGWAEVMLDHIDSGGEKAGYCQLRFDQPGLAARIVAGWANMRAKRFGVPFGDQSLLISRELYDQVGGYRDQPLMEDVAMARALKGALVELAITAQTSGAKYVQEGWIRRGARNLWLQIRYLNGADPHALAQAYQPSDRPS